jgi:hypothetical protein
MKKGKILMESEKCKIKNGITKNGNMNFQNCRRVGEYLNL